MPSLVAEAEVDVAATAEEDVQMETEEFVNIDALQDAGINVADITKLKQVGLCSVGAVLQRSKRHLLTIKGMSEAKVDKIISACEKLVPSMSARVATGLEIRERRKGVVKISCGSKQVDSILGGGVETGCITEFFGEFRSGKTQMCHTLAVTSQLSKDFGGGEGKVFYLDTENNFRPSRIEQICERFGLDPDETLENIVIFRAFNHEDQMEAMRHIAALFAEQGCFRTLIVDSIIAHFRSEFSGRGELAERQQKLSKHMADLTRIAEEFNVAVVILNQCMADPGAMSMFGPVLKPVGGNIIAHASTVRVFLKKSKGCQRIAVIYDSPSMPEADAVFQITSGGIADLD